MSDTREYLQTIDWPVITLPLNGSERAEIWQDGKQRQGPLSVLGGVPSAHASSHQDGGTDEISTDTPAGNAIPKADSSGTLDAWVSDGGTTRKGKLQLATDGESSALKALSSTDARLSNARTPTAHAATHITGGTDVIADASATKSGLLSAAMKTKVDSITVANIPTADQKAALVGSSGTPSSTNRYLTAVEKGSASGLCPLGTDSKVASTYLPSYVDDVIEVANYAALPVTGEASKIYITLDTNLTYRWTGSAYAEISASLALGETSSTAYRGDRGKIAYDHSQITGNPHGATQDNIGDGATYKQYSQTEKTKLSGIAEGAEVNVNADWISTSGDAQILNKPSLALLTDLSRVMHITGDGVPTFPDNVAGRTYWQDSFATVDSWAATGGTASVSGGFLAMTYSGTSGKIERSFTSFSAKEIRATVKINVTGYVNLFGTVGGVSDTLIKTIPVTAGVLTTLDAYIAGAVTVLYFTISTPSSGYILSIDTIYIGSGLFDTPVYDKACCNRATNNGVLPVLGPRGLGLAFNGAQYLQFDNPVTGTTGTIYLRFAVTALLPAANKVLFDNRNASTNRSGIAIYQSTANVITMIFADASASQSVVIGTITTTGIYTAGCMFTPTTATVFLSEAIGSTTALTVGSFLSETNAIAGWNTPKTSGNGFAGIIYNIGFRGNIWTQADVDRYANGDDPVDSQQKSVTATPHSIMTRKSDGRTEVATGTASLDATNKSQMDTAITAALSSILYETFAAAATFTAGQLGYLNSSGQVALFDASAESTAKGALYIATAGITSGASGTFQRTGEYTTTGLTAGATYYGSETAGAYTTTAPTTSAAVVRIIGYAQSTTVLFFSPSNDYVVLV